MKDKILVVTSNRADYGLLKPVIEKLIKKVELEIIVTGSHLSHEFGYTIKEIEQDNIPISEKIEILLSSDSKVSVSKSIGLAILSFSEVIERIQPTKALLLGDRFEMFAVASSLLVADIPIIHLYGGESSEGVLDNTYRNCITKMSTLHLTANDTYSKRVIQMGENPNSVFTVGAIGVENAKNLSLLSDEEVLRLVPFIFIRPTILITYHPTISDNEDTLGNLLSVLEQNLDLGVVFTKANCDEGGRKINETIDLFSNNNSDRVLCFESLGHAKYLSIMKRSVAVVGNSSSLVVEAPALKIPSLIIGSRQDGRLLSDSTLKCNTDMVSIQESMSKVLSNDIVKNAKYSINPYGEGDISSKIVEIILANDIIKPSEKVFFDIEKHNQ